MLLKQRKRLLLAIVLIQGMSILAAPTIHEPASDQYTPEKIDELWSSLDPKPTPIYQCTGWYGGNKMIIPKAPDCSMPARHDENKVVSVTLYLPDIGRQTITGYECYAVYTSEWISRNFFDARRSGSSIEYLRVTGDACWNMVKNRKSPRDETMDGDSRGIIGTANKLVVESAWCRNKSASVTNYYFREVSVSVYELDKSIITSTDTREPCYYNNTSCATTLGILVWKNSDFKSCRLAEVGRSQCIYSQSSTHSRLTCPDYELSVHGISEIEMCGLVFGSSMQGYHFLENEGGKISRSISLSEEAAGIITKPKHSGDETKDTSRVVNLDVFNNGKFGYLYDSLKDSVEGAFQIVHHDICKTNHLLWTSLSTTAKTGNPSEIVQVLFDDPSLRASFSGDVLNVWQCHSIFHYKFMKRESCLYEYPVQYVQNGRQYTAFVIPQTHVITDQATKMIEPCSEFYFDAHDYYLHLTDDGPKLANIPSLPQPNLGTKDIRLPHITFNTTSGIDFSGYSDFMLAQNNFKEALIRLEMIQNITKGAEDVQEAISPFQAAYGVGSYLLWPLSFVYTYFGYLAIGALLFLCLLGIKVICSPASLCLSAFRCGRFLVRIMLWPCKKVLIKLLGLAGKQRVETVQIYPSLSEVTIDNNNRGDVRQRVIPSAPYTPPVPPRK